ncbi:hypothetical protein JCM3765_001181 [Sporobolomyces pararoseus]
MPPHLTRYFGLSPLIDSKQILASLTSSCLSISFLVFISSSTPFLLSSSSTEIPSNRVGDVTGKLVFVDELTALGLYLPIGSLMDLNGVRKVTSIGYLVVAVGLISYSQSTKVWQLVVARIVFAAGAASLVASISAILSSLTPVPNKPKSTRRNYPNENSPLLEHKQVEKTSGRLAGMIGFSSGLGALLAVFGYLRLPGFISNHLSTSSSNGDDDDNLAKGLVISFYLVAAIAFLEGIFVFFALPPPLLPPPTRRDSTSSFNESIRERGGFKKVLKTLAKRLGMGFLIAKDNQEVSLALLTSFATRAQAVIVTAMIPLLVNRYFLEHDLCSNNPLLLLPSSPPPRLKHSCRQAYILSSILSGIVQLVTLLLSPLIGFLTSCQFLSKNSKNPHAFVLLVAFLVGTISCIGFTGGVTDIGPTTNGYDPRKRKNWIWSIGLGISQSSGTVISLSLLTKNRGKILSERRLIRIIDDVQEDEEEERSENFGEIGGSLSSASSFVGGVGILIIGTLGGILFDRWSEGAPFWLLAGVNLVVALGSLKVLFSRKDDETDDEDQLE